MALRIHSKWSYLEQEFGCSIRDHFLMAVRSLDNPKAVTPLLLEHDGRRSAFFLHVEKGNVEAARLPPDIAPVYYRPYFTFEPSEADVAHMTLADAVEQVAGGGREIMLDAAAPMAIASELLTRFKVTLEDAPAAGTVTLREVPCAEIAARLARGRPAAARAAAQLLERSPVRERFLPYLQAHGERRFATLDEAMAQAEFTTIVVSSTLNAQEIAGVPVGRKLRPLAAFYSVGQGRAWVMEPGIASGGRTFPSPKAALKHVAPTGRLGIETEDVGVGLARALGLDNREWGAAGGAIRQWRDENTLGDLPYYIIASRTTRHAIAAALDFAAEAIRREVRATEADSFRRYLDAMRDFARAALPGSHVTRTLTNFHCGARTIFPSNPAAHALDESIGTLKIDAGCMLFDEEGMLLGCSDIARTIGGSEAVRELHEAFGRGVRRRLIPGARAGRAGAELHAEAVDELWGNRRLAGNPLFVELKDPGREYDRDVGHLLGKNNLAHLRLVHDESQRLREGMIACCEYQWPIHGHAIAYEDTCLVTPSGGLNITSDDE